MGDAGEQGGGRGQGREGFHGKASMEWSRRPNKPANRDKMPISPGELRRQSGRNDVVRTGQAAVITAVRPEGIHDRTGRIREEDAERVLPPLK
jgi:hypothetical protein